ncbi:MAG: prepilin peptidase [Alphaproteobacteria bacterium]|nr:prepilin peptidase [Alphaproteobacteria bacterium]
MTLPAAIFLVSALLGGLAIGSFLTVVIARLPPLVLRDEGLFATGGQALAAISWPGSRCDACGVALAWHDNIPLISCLLLKGQCRHCGHGFGRQYIAVELLTAGAALLSVLMLGWTAQAAWVFGLLAVLLALAMIDLAEQLLPDILVLPLLPLGLCYGALYGPGLMASLEGAACAGLLLLAIGMAYRWRAKIEGMGQGDVKLAAALGAWLGLESVPFFLVLAFALGLVACLPSLLKGRLGGQSAIAFGPFLCASAAIFVLVPAVTPWIERLLEPF